MNGPSKVVLLDTNAVIALLGGNPDLLAKCDAAETVAISVITHLEFLAFSRLTNVERELYGDFLAKVRVVGLTLADTDLLERVIEVRQLMKLRLPDAIVVATATHLQAVLLTRDQTILRVVPSNASVY
jgi:predicted nucleic acid-binding protein